MTDIQITPLDGSRFGVRVVEGENFTDHEVHVPDGFVDDLAMPDVDTETLVRESFHFLLEREPATSILREFALPQISDYFPEYLDELRTRLSP